MLWDSSQVTRGRALEEAGLEGALDRLYELTDAQRWAGSSAAPGTARRCS